MLNLHKPGRVRRVRDAAAKYQGPSLNDHLLTGPDLLNSCVGVLLRFSQELIAMSADIEAMFSQVVVPEEDQSELRFVWGRSCSPTCSNYVLRRTAQDSKDFFPLEAEVVETTF